MRRATVGIVAAGMLATVALATATAASAHPQSQSHGQSHRNDRGLAANSRAHHVARQVQPRHTSVRLGVSHDGRLQAKLSRLTLRTRDHRACTAHHRDRTAFTVSHLAAALARDQRQVLIQSITVDVHKILHRVGTSVGKTITTGVNPVLTTIDQVASPPRPAPPSVTPRTNPPPTATTAAGHSTSSDRNTTVRATSSDAIPTATARPAQRVPATTAPAQPRTPKTPTPTPGHTVSPQPHAVPTPAHTVAPKPPAHKHALGAFNSIALRSTTAMAILAGIALITVAAMAYVIGIGRRGRRT